MKFFEKFFPYKGGFNEKYPTEIFHSFEFFKYYAFDGQTIVNYPKMFYGQTREVKNKTRITKYLNENGYITGYANDHCFFDNIPTNHNLTQEEVYNHQMTQCDLNLAHYCSMIIRCIYGKGNWDLYNYGNQFWRKYKDNRKYLNIVSNDAHEKHELPMLFIVTNDRKNKTFEEQYKYIQENQQTFITCLDVYDTILNIIYGDQYFLFNDKEEDNNSIRAKQGKSLFTKIEQKSRSPKLYDEMLDVSCK